MKTKLLLLAVFLAIKAQSAEIAWAANPAEDLVTKYILEYRLATETNWTRVEVAGNITTVKIPEPAFGRWFRIAAANVFGQSEWTTPTRLPNKITNLQLLNP